MTEDELKKLAEIAGLRIHQTLSDWYVKDISKTREIAIMIKDWHPHLNIEQAMMVAEAKFGWFSLKRSRLDENDWIYSFQGAYKTIHGVLLSNGEGKTSAEAICHAALAAKEG